jgi:uncharacterized protein (DUF433 family)
MIRQLPVATSEPRQSPARRLTLEETKVIAASLARPLGRYDSARASQLSGIPRRTVNYWFQHDLLVPDDRAERKWSYRDLVYLRVFAWLRTKHMAPDVAAARVSELRRAHLSDGAQITHVRSQGKELLLGDEAIDRLSGELVIAEVARFFHHLDLVAFTQTVDLESGRYEGPDLLRPRSRVTIRPWVLSGEPCIRGTRIATLSMYVLNNERGLQPDEIARLYPGTDLLDITQAIDLEASLRKGSSLN